MGGGYCGRERGVVGMGGLLGPSLLPRPRGLRKRIPARRRLTCDTLPPPDPTPTFEEDNSMAIVWLPSLMR